jgi:hypothetical protein
VINPGSSALEIAKFLEHEKDIDQSWKPVGYVSYPRLIRNLERFLYEKARERLPSYRYERIRIKTNVNRNDGLITVEVEECKHQLRRGTETSLMIRPPSAIVLYNKIKHGVKKWIAKTLLIDI